MLCAGNVREPDRGVGLVNDVGMGIERVWDGEDRGSELFSYFYMAMDN